MSAGISPLVSTKKRWGGGKGASGGGGGAGGRGAGGDLAIAVPHQWRVLAAWCLAQGYRGKATLPGD